MKTSDIKINQLIKAPWNPNRMDEKTASHLKESITRYGVVIPLVVRPLDNNEYEVLSGNQRLKVLKDCNFEDIPCVIVNLGDSEAMLLAQALNTVHGEDDLAMKGEMFRKVLAEIPEDRILSLLPETAESLQSLTEISQVDLAEHLKAWQEAQAVRLRHMQLQFTNKQLETVEEALSFIEATAREEQIENPNRRGNAIFYLCRFYLERRKLK